MKVVAINGSPRKNRNTAELLKNALEGAALAGANTQIYHLYDLTYKGCCSCFQCKKKNGVIHGQCVMNDDLNVVLHTVMESDVLLLGSPIYLGNITGEMKSFLERLVFANLSYDSPSRTNCSKTISSGFVYTMGLPHGMADSVGYPYIFETNKSYLKLLNGESVYITSEDTYQFEDYSKYAASNFDETHKAAVREKQFPLDCQKAFEMGKRLVENRPV